MKYVGIFEESGKVVPEEEAYQYAKEHLDEMPEKDKKLFVEFFFSGNWIEKEKWEEEDERKFNI